MAVRPYSDTTIRINHFAREARSGRPESVERLCCEVHSWAHKLLWDYRPEDRKDIAQNITIKAWTSLVSCKGDFFPFLKAIFLHTKADFHRTNAKHDRTSALTSTKEAEDFPDTVDENSIASPLNLEKDVADREIVDYVFDLLPSDNRRAFLLCDVEGLTCIEASSILNTNPAVVYQRRKRARDRVRALLIELAA